MDECGYAQEFICSDETTEITLAVDTAGNLVELSVRREIEGELCAYRANDVPYDPYTPPE